MSSLLGIVVSLSPLLVIACTRPAQEEEVLPQREIDLQLGVTFKHNAHAYELGSIYTDAAGHDYRLDTLRFVISAPRAMDHYEVSVANFPQTCLLVDASQTNVFPLGMVQAHHLHEIRFKLGLDADLNHADPISTPALGSLAPMHSGSMAEGHYFLVLSGQVDGNGDGILDESDPGFTFKCMGDALLRQALAPAHADLPGSGPFTAWAVVDMAKLMEGIDLLGTPSSTGADTINLQLMDQLVEAMEQLH